MLSIIIPTYNERENIEPLYRGITEVLDEFEIIFVDDNSPDGTARVIKEIQAQDRRVKLLEREAKLGLGSAILDGLKLATGEYIAMMDADLSHSPREIPQMLKALEEADIVIGSRYIEGGRIEGWSPIRHLISRVAILISHFLLGIKVKDPTSGFALFRREVIEKIKEDLSPKGYKLLLEIIVKSPGASIKEVPITFKNRAYGKSKLDFKEVIEYLKLCWRLRRVLSP